MPNTSIRLRLILTLLLIIGGGALLQVGSYFLERGEMVETQERAARIQGLRELRDQLDGALNSQHGSLLEYIVTGDPAYLQIYNAARTEEARLIDSSVAISPGDTTLAADLGAFRRATDAWRDSFANTSIALMQADGGTAARQAGRNRAGEVLYADILAADLAFDAHVGELSATGLAQLDTIVQNQLILFLVGLLGSLAGLLLAVSLLARWLLRPLRALLATARQVEAGEDVTFRSDRADEIGRLGQALEHMRVGLFGQAAEASVINRFTELTAFVEVDDDVARATLDALAELAVPDHGTIHLSNRSRDRAIPAGSIGDIAPEVVSLGQLAHCPGVRRSSLYVMSDLAAPMSVRCPVYPGTTGTVACLPLIALGEVVGAVHLHWNAADSLPLEIRSAVTRIADHASLSIANRRLVIALQGQASTDGRTGLPNSRTFDETLEACLARRDEGEPASVLMLDIDHFKLFNDRNGHPAGDRALRAFAGVLRSTIRDGDMAARYGGEEFAVLLPGACVTEALAVAERIRTRTEEAVIDLSPGHRDEITVSIGVATWPTDGADRVKLLEVADAALYRAKNTGRNRVVAAGSAFALRGGEDGPPTAEPGSQFEGGLVARAPEPPRPIALPRAI